MSDFDILCEDIKSSMNLTVQEGSGFYACHCPICNKTDRKTGGFRFESDKIGYNCFRASCDASCVYEVGRPISRKFRALMGAVGVSIPINLRMVRSSFQKAIDSLDEDLYTKHFYKEMKIPKGWVSLEEDGNPKWLDYYHSRRCDTSNIFYVKKGPYKGLTAIGMYYFDKLIGFQVADPTGYVKYRTITDNDHPIMVHDGFLQDPVIVVEGVLDSLCFPNTVGILRSKISKEQAYFLRGRDVILLPDKSGNSFIHQMKDYGWKIALPEWGNCKDLNEAVIKYGKLNVAEMIKRATYDNTTKASVAYRLWVDKERS